MRVMFGFLFCLGLLSGFSMASEDPQAQPLWPEGAPGAHGKETGGENNPGDVPTITVWLPPKEKATGASVVICPGGGYGFLATDHEGKQVAEWLNSIGVAGIMVKYRLSPKYKHPAPLEDAQRAIRTVRAKSKEWGLDPKRVGVMGFSAGGHLASTAATHFDEGKAEATDPIDRESCRPDVAVLVYPVISFTAEYAHKGSANSLLGKDATKEMLTNLSNETQVTEATPPTFLAHTLGDTGVPMENSLSFAMGLRKAKVPFELHIFEKGQHGLGLGTGSKQHNVAGDPAFEAWPKLCATWLKSRGFLNKM